MVLLVLEVVYNLLDDGTLQRCRLFLVVKLLVIGFGGWCSLSMMLLETKNA